MLAPAKKLEYVPDPNKFDLRTHIWNGQGQLKATNTYRCFIIEGRQYFERPVNSGNLWFENNQPAGRVELTFNDKGHIASKKFEFDALHTDFVPELRGADKVSFELEQARKQNAELQLELQQIRKEREMVRAVQEGIPPASVPASVAAALVPAPAKAGPPTLKGTKPQGG